MTIKYLLNNAQAAQIVSPITSNMSIVKSVVYLGKLIYVMNRGIYIFTAKKSMRLIKFI